MDLISDFNPWMASLSARKALLWLYKRLELLCSSFLLLPFMGFLYEKKGLLDGMSDADESVSYEPCFLFSYINACIMAYSNNHPMFVR
jgi:hypothetical protein